MNKPKISIILPVYNTERYLEKCLDSLIHQTFSEIEIICIDDGSTDKSSAILRQYERKDCRIKVISQSNQGVSEARNIGICNASAEYIMFLDSDDWLDPDTCETAYDVMRQQKADIVMWSYIREFENKSIPKKIFDKNESQIVFEGKEVQTIQRRIVGLIGEELKNPERMDALSAVWGKLYRRQLITENKIEFIDVKKIGSAEDVLLNLQIIGYAEKIVFLNKYFNHYRKNNRQSITNNLSSYLYQQRGNLFAYMQDYIEKKDLHEDFQKALNNRIAMSIVGLGITILKNDRSLVRNIRQIKAIITSERYRDAYKQLELTYFPIYWRVFYFFARHECAVGLYILLQMIKAIKKSL